MQCLKKILRFRSDIRNPATIKGGKDVIKALPIVGGLFLFIGLQPMP